MTTVAQPCEYNKNHSTVYFYMVNFTSELYLDFFLKKDTLIWEALFGSMTSIYLPP